VEPLDEVDLALVLPGPGGPQWSALAGEAHEATVVAGVLEGCVVVLQDDLGEDTVHAPAVGLGRERKSILDDLFVILLLSWFLLG
jgi:hypothetical protein